MSIDSPIPPLAEQVAALEACLDVASTPAAQALTQAIVARLEAVDAHDSVATREGAVRGFLVVSHQLYRTGQLRRAGDVLRAARELSSGLDTDTRLTLLLRSGEYEMLVFDVG